MNRDLQQLALGVAMVIVGLALTYSFLGQVLIDLVKQSFVLVK